MVIHVQEHFYDDNPQQGHTDVRTRLKDASYFFLGNGYIQAAVQVAPSGEGTAVGLLVMNPERLRKKREALTFDPDSGLENTMVRILSANLIDAPGAQALKASWSEELGVPSVRVAWGSGRLQVVEYFFCPNRSQPALIREVRIRNTTHRSFRIHFQTGILEKRYEQESVLKIGEETKIILRYSLDEPGNKVQLDVIPESEVSREARKYWKERAQASFGSELLDRYFQASKFQLPAVISRRGKVDGSIWQYNREWVRDQAMLTIGLTLAGHRELARTMLVRLLDEFVTEEGDTVDSSERRSIDEVELDQNGVLLYALKTHILWTGDFELAAEKWKKIKRTTEYPLREIFRHQPSGLLVNRREFWERHRIHGVERGMELAQQFFTVVGLLSASWLARMTSHEPEASYWEKEAERIKQAFLYDPKYRLVDRRGLIKRRKESGPFQEFVEPLPEAQLPEGVPLATRGLHLLNPDTSAALPIAMGLLPPDSPVASATLAGLEALWNQAWQGGGYGRYNMSSEPDSAGPWPFASLFIARAYVEKGDFEKVGRILHWLNTVPGARAGSWFEFYGERLSPPFPQVGIIPWTWAEMLILFVHHIIGVQPDGDYIRLRPRLLPGMERVEASFPLRKGRLHLKIQKGPRRKYFGFRSGTKFISSSESEALIAYPETNLWVEAFMR